MRSLVLLPILLVSPSRPAFAAIEDQHVPEVEEEAPPPAPVLTRPPELVEFVNAEYPEELLMKGVAGEVMLLIDIDADGSVARVEATSASDPAFTAPALAAAAQFRFTPAEIDGVPAQIRIEYRYVFEPQVPEPDAIAGEPTSINAEMQAINFRGRVRIAGDRRPISGAVLSIGGRPVAETGRNGNFAVRGVQPGRFRVRITAPGYETYEITEEVGEEEAVEVNYYLVKTSTSPFEAVVRTRKDRREVSKVQLQRQELEKVPGTFGDPVRVIENLPGMGRVPGGLGGALLVRGERPTATGVYVDGVEIPQLYHFGGLTSVINSEFLERIDFYPGGFGARYGDATAGIVNIVSRDVECDLWRGSGKADFIDSAAFTCVPAGAWRVAAAGRRSYVDAFLPSVLDALPLEEDQGAVTLSPVYWDYQAKAHRLMGDHTFDIFAFGADDAFKLVQTGSFEDVNFDFGLHLTSHSLLLRHRWQISDKMKLTTGVAPQYVRNEFRQTSAEINVDNSFVLAVWSVGWREDFEWEVSDWLTVNAGLDHRFGAADLDIEVPAVTDLSIFPSPVFDFTDAKQFAWDIEQYNHGYFVEAVVEPFDGLRIVPGLRLDRFDFESTQDISILPRLTGRWEFLDGTTAKAAYGLYEKLPEPNFLIPGIGNPALEPERAHQFIAGVEHEFTDLLNLDVQVFYNLRSNIPSPSRSVAFDDGEAVPEMWDSGGAGRAYGLEILLRYLATAEGRFYGWIAYTLSRSLRRDRRPDATYVIQAADGSSRAFEYSERSQQEYLSNFDQPHILTVVAQWILPWGFEAGFRFRLVSGNPRTPLEGGVVWYDADSDTYQDDLAGVPRNSGRMPAFHQLDVRVDKTFTFDLWKLTAYLEVINAYNRRNVEQYQYDYRYEESAALRLLPIIPILGIKGAF